jgi:hypothetical protein
MKKNILVFIYLIIALLCAILIPVTNPPLRNYIPIIWGIYGFGFHAVLFNVITIQLDRKLRRDYKNVLDDLKIKTENAFGIPRINVFVMLYNKSLKESVDGKTRAQLKFLKLNFILVSIAFVLFAVFGILTVVMTWKK